MIQVGTVRHTHDFTIVLFWRIPQHIFIHYTFKYIMIMSGELHLSLSLLNIISIKNAVYKQFTL
jgi:hypothetical protein